MYSLHVQILVMMMMQWVSSNLFMTMRLIESDKVRVLHWHVETLLDERVLVVDIRARADILLCSRSMVNTLHALRLESLLWRVEHNCILDVLVSWLVEGLWSIWYISLILVETWSRHFKFKTSAIEYLVVVESWRGCIKTDSSARCGFKITCSLLPMFPLIQSLHACDLIFSTKDSFFIIDVFSLITLCHNLGSFATFALKDADAWILGWEWHIETIRGRLEHAVWHSLLHCQSSLHPSLRMTLCRSTLNGKVHGRLGDDRRNVILTWVRSILWC